ncbi:hypothetical protein [Paractinoplanes toevensis]|uniref:Uncharacterized protein n=1 Tax=Paractinoplanes toevensis TaxID=571911 RepID=A0A919W9M4_9ACTN|nr:hypothetical protein [Actinoplanes toevensis]GIM96125.1 hypothetical protein Ato02nite_079180 [Actinoplanes toevensis]
MPTLVLLPQRPELVAAGEQHFGEPGRAGTGAAAGRAAERGQVAGERDAERVLPQRLAEFGDDLRAARRFIGAMSARGMLFGTAETAGLAALYAATADTARAGRPRAPGRAARGAEAVLAAAQDAARVWQISEALTKVTA